MPSVIKKWEKVCRSPDELDKEDIFEEFLPLQTKCLKNYTQLLPGVAKTSQDLQKLEFNRSYNWVFKRNG